MKIVIASGGFDPVHSGHVSYLQEARRLGHVLIVGLNSDAWLTRKKGKSFMSFEERRAVLSSIRFVDRVLEFNDDDGSAVDLIRKVQKLWPDNVFIVANGGDRVESNNLEIGVEGVEFVYGVGGFDKKNSSSEILKKWNE
jgi:D-beta-D-heptose 7-phosphate kinase/D-beta-D-heptose 1-phosphate adenosyltransferase